MYLYRLQEFLLIWLWWALEYWEGLYFRHTVRLLQVCLSTVSMLGIVLFIFYFYFYKKKLSLECCIYKISLLFLKSFNWTFVLDAADASKSGVAQETVQNLRRASKIMAEPEARQILGVTERSSWEEILKVCFIAIYLFLVINPWFIMPFSCEILIEVFPWTMCRNMTACLSKMQRMGVFTFNQRSIELKNV